MKQFKLREEKTFIKILKEPPLKKKKTNWNRLSYLAIALVVFFFLGKRIYTGNMIIFADGQIELPKQTIKFPHDIKVLQLQIDEGSSICQGDTLFVYKVTEDPNSQAKLQIDGGSKDWILKEILAIKKKIELNQLLIKNKKIHLELIQSNLLAKETMLMGGIHDEYNQYSNLMVRKEEALSEIELLKGEIKLYRNHLYRLNKNQKDIDALAAQNLAKYEQIQYYTAPSDGVISEISHEQNEICYKKEDIMTIHQLTDATISTYFDPQEIAHLNIGDAVDISFPDGSIQQGLISKFYVSTYALPSEFQKKYEPTERNIVAQVIPMNKSEANHWRNFYKMDVKVKKNRYNFI